MKKENDFKFWDIRSDNYDRLFWTNDDSYIKEIIDFADFKKNQLALDVGTGTGVIARSIKPYVKHVVAIDTSDSMLKNGKWDDVSVVKCDINDSFFTHSLFDRITARMVFHHILDNLDRAMLRCYDVLKEKGVIVIAEGIPPTTEPHVINWFTEMFKLKEHRRTFLESDLKFYLEKNGFKRVNSKKYIMEQFNVNNWLENSGLKKSLQRKIYNTHIHADQKIKKAYNMKVKNDICTIRTVNLIIRGQK